MSKWVLVTGSSRGIGRATALQLARDGYNLVLHCRNRRGQVEEVATEIAALGCESRILQFDIVDRVTARRILLDDVEAHGCYYGVVCNAGLTADNAFPAMPAEDWDRVVHTNLDGFYNVLNPLIMPMVRNKTPGRIVVMSSVSGLAGNRGQVNYSASKAGLIGASKALALELAKRRITVNCVAPGLIATEMVDGDLPLDEIMKMIPVRRLGKPEEVAATVSFLMDERAAYITRQVISVNGGLY
ncbi:3-oxoacyl-ACP reductase FabG [Microbulbifer discodermiae]|uniref:3-oxoacyl-ACP reductase FabG n=1 Tax=Microbulbifer sp. 2201CG32-9 TaxID=3232309 RepID=UPI00345C2A17